MSDEIRKVGDHTVFQSIHIGDKEIIVAECVDTPSARYLVANCTSNGIMELYSDGLVSESYAEIMQVA